MLLIYYCYVLDINKMETFNVSSAVYVIRRLQISLLHTTTYNSNLLVQSRVKQEAVGIVQL